MVKTKKTSLPLGIDKVLVFKISHLNIMGAIIIRKIIYIWDQSKTLDLTHIMRRDNCCDIRILTKV